jgi:hypothetical protein
MQACSRLAKLVPVRSVQPSDDLAALPEFVQVLVG